MRRISIDIGGSVTDLFACDDTTREITVAKGQQLPRTSRRQGLHGRDGAPEPLVVSRSVFASAVLIDSTSKEAIGH
jgi:hypothetical protein